MGIFSFLKKDQGRTDEKVMGQLRPNKYGNFLYPPRALFTVHGTNPKTGRQNKKVFEAIDATEAEALASAAGLIPPFETSCGPMDGPSEAQVEYAANVGITIPEGACKEDVSALLTRYEKDDPERATAGFLEYLAAKGWRHSSLVGYKEMFWQAMKCTESPPDEREQIALYAYCAVQGEKGREIGNLLTDPRKERYFAFADRVLADGKLLASFRRQTFREYYQPEKRSAIYQATKELV